MISLLLISNNQQNIKKYLDEKYLNQDFLILRVVPENKKYSIEEIKTLRKETMVFNEKKRVYLLENFHLSSIEAQNSFLKLLEEPPNNVIFILTSDNEEKIISTIKSRTKIIYLDKKNKLSLEKKTEDEIRKIIESKKIKFLQKEISIDDIIGFYHQRLKTDKKASLILKEALKIKSLLETNNLNKQLAIDHLLIFIYNCYNG